MVEARSHITSSCLSIAVSVLFNIALQFPLIHYFLVTQNFRRFGREQPLTIDPFRLSISPLTSVTDGAVPFPRHTQESPIGSSGHSLQEHQKYQELQRPANGQCKLGLAETH